MASTKIGIALLGVVLAVGGCTEVSGRRYKTVDSWRRVDYVTLQVSVSTIKLANGEFNGFDNNPTKSSIIVTDFFELKSNYLKKSKEISVIESKKNKDNDVIDEFVLDNSSFKLYKKIRKNKLEIFNFEYRFFDEKRNKYYNISNLDSSKSIILFDINNDKSVDIVFDIFLEKQQICFQYIIAVKNLRSQVCYNAI